MVRDPGPAVLVADDEPQLLRVVVRVLERAGHPVFAANDGSEARAVFDEHSDELDAVVLDAEIVPDGVDDLLAHIRAARPRVGRVLMSGDLLRPELDRELKERGGAFLRKPFPPEALLEAVERVAGEGDS